MIYWSVRMDAWLELAWVALGEGIRDLAQSDVLEAPIPVGLWGKDLVMIVDLCVAEVGVTVLFVISWQLLSVILYVGF